MGSLTSKAVTLSGDEVTVSFIADEFADGALPPITSITMQMDGGAEYSPLKMTTASIGFVVDDLSLLKICSVEYPVRVTIDNNARNKTMFNGYIVPNSYNQQLTGVNDMVTVECVDCLGYAKHINYSQLDAKSGFAAIRVDDLILHCMTLIGAMQRHARVMFPQSVGVWRGVNNLGVESLRLAENYFFSSDIPDEATGDYRPHAMTCDQVLSMIAESLRLTWMSDGLDIWLREELSAVDGDVVYVDLVAQETVTQPVIHEVTEDDSATTEWNVSTLSRVSMTEVTHSLAESVQVMQDPLNIETLVADGEYEEYYNPVDDDEYRRIISLPLRSNIFDTYYPVGEDKPKMYSRFVAWCENRSVTPEPGSPEFIDDYAWGDGSWTVALKMRSDSEQSLQPLLKRKMKFSTPVIGSALRTLHIAAEVAVIEPPEDEDVEDEVLEAMNEHLWPWQEYDKSINCELLVSVIVDGRYYDPSTDSYTTEQKVFRVNVFADGTAHWNIYDIYDKVEDGLPVPDCGTLEFVIYSNGKYDAKWTTAWLKKLELTLKSNVYALRGDLLKPAVERVGSWDINRVQRIEPPLSVYYNLNERPVHVPLFAGVYGGVPELLYTINGVNISFAEYAHRLANMGDRLMFQIPLRDEANAYTALDAFTCPLWTGCKVVAGYVRDVLDNTITLTLI